MDVIRCKIALVGECRVGKTSIINQLVKNSFNGSYQTTLGIDYNQYEIKIKETNYIVQFHILDFSGFSIFRDLINNIIKEVSTTIHEIRNAVSIVLIDSDIAVLIFNRITFFIFYHIIKDVFKNAS